MESTLESLGGCIVGRVLTVRQHVDSTLKEKFAFDDVEALVDDGGKSVAGFFARRNTLVPGELCVIVNKGVILDARDPRSFNVMSGRLVGNEQSGIFFECLGATALPVRDFEEVGARIVFNKGAGRDVWENEDPVLLGRDVTRLIGAMYTKPNGGGQ